MLALLSLFLAVNAAPARALAPDLAKLVGVFESNGHRFVVRPAGNTLALSTDAELSKSAACHKHLGAATGQYYDPRFPGAAEVYFQLSPCPGVDGHVTLHYNRAFTGIDVYLIDVVIRRNTYPMNPHNIQNGLTVRWSLRKLSGS